MLVLVVAVEILLLVIFSGAVHTDKLEARGARDVVPFSAMRGALELHHEVCLDLRKGVVDRIKVCEVALPR
eukprot:7914177-Lingulodinium_polyedra.AAC.1